MLIKEIRLKGYKRFSKLTINLGDSPSRIVALVGPNGCGKSGVLNSMIFHSSAYESIGFTGTRSYEYHSLHKEPNYDYQNIEIFFDEGGNYPSIRQARNNTGKTNTIFSLRSPYRYNSNLKITESKAVSDIKSNTYGASSFSDLDDKMTDNYRRLLIKYNSYMNKEDLKPSEAKTKIIGDLNRAIKECLNLEITSLGDIDANKGSIYIKKPDTEREFEFNLLSAGEKEVIDILLDLYLRKDDFDDSIYLIDEPELHLNSTIQRKLLIEIEKMIPKKCQIWIATHSIGFLRALQEDFKDRSQIIEFSMDNRWASESYHLTPMAKTRSNWKRIFAIALDDLTSLLAPQEIIYCEGKLNNSLDEKIFNEMFSSKYDNSLFISSTNKSESQKYACIALTILNKAFVGVKIKVLVDRDDDIIIPKTPQVNVITLERREFENYLFDFQVLVASYPALSKEEYDKIISDVMKDDLKSKMLEIMKLCGETNSNMFKNTLAKNFPKDCDAYKELEKIIFT